MKIISRTPPVYPVIAREKHIEGTVILRLHIGADGNVRSVITEPDTLDYLLVKAAITAVLQWKFKPALDMHGHPTSRWIELPMRFGLSTRHH